MQTRARDFGENGFIFHFAQFFTLFTATFTFHAFCWFAPLYTYNPHQMQSCVLTSRIESYSPARGEPGRWNRELSCGQEGICCTSIEPESRDSSVENFGQSEHDTCHSWQQERRGCVCGVFTRPIARNRPNHTQTGRSGRSFFRRHAVRSRMPAPFRDKATRRCYAVPHA